MVGYRSFFCSWNQDLDVPLLKTVVGLSLTLTYKGVNSDTPLTSGTVVDLKSNHSGTSSLELIEHGPKRGF